MFRKLYCYSIGPLVVLFGLAVLCGSAKANAIPTQSITTANLPKTFTFNQGTTEALLITITDDAFSGTNPPAPVVPFWTPITGPGETSTSSPGDIVVIANNAARPAQATICFASDPDVGMCTKTGRMDPSHDEAPGAVKFDALALERHTFALGLTVSSDVDPASGEPATGQSDSITLTKVTVPEPDMLAVSCLGCLGSCVFLRLHIRRGSQTKL